MVGYGTCVQFYSQAWDEDTSFSFFSIIGANMLELNKSVSGLVSH